eukprot:508941_1
MSFVTFIYCIIILIQDGSECKCIVPNVQVNSDVECNFDEMLQSDPLSLARAKEADALWALVNQEELPKTYDHIDIPIVFHILYDETDANQVVDPNQLYSTYIDILKRLNLDYNMRNPDITTFELWQDRISNMSLSFFLNKIVYVPTVGSHSPYAHREKETIQSTDNGGHSPLDAAHNLDIWFIYGKDTSFSAYAQFPSDQLAGWHGVTVNIAYLKGEKVRPSIYTHEIGHWIGLYHIWGRYKTECVIEPGDGGDDIVDDTPDMAANYSGPCPKCHPNTCPIEDVPSDDEPDMFENFMSYAECRNMFTAGQVAKSRDTNEGVGIRETIRNDYTQSEHMTPDRFVNMFYFVDDDEECIINHVRKDYCVNRKNKPKKCTKYRNCDVSLCVRYSRSTFAYRYEDIELITGDNTSSCASEFMKIDTILLTRDNEDGQEENVYACYKKEDKEDPEEALPWDLTIVDVDLELSNNQLKLILNTAGGDVIVKSVRFYPGSKPTAEPTPAPLWPTKKPRKKKYKRKDKK